ncbi:MAG: glycosyltransferase family 39 protein [Candidatus Curtissbacteria bacterium]|nr:glycosyltransferase family 39 protein [Candidatus Curtissbacteria bacterium]
MKLKKNFVFLCVVLTLGLFMRLSRIRDFYIFEADQEINSFIVKDIFIDHHIRLIGQMSSIEGIFLGPLLNYFLSPFYAIFGMDPIGGVVAVTLISLATIASIYFVFSEFFDTVTARVATFLYSVSLPIVFIDRWVVPSQGVFLWSIWFIFALLSILRGNFKALILIGLLAGVAWNIHPTLVPSLLLVPVAVFLSRKKPHLREVIISTAIFLISSLPLLAFEARHGFTMLKALGKLFTSSDPGLPLALKLNLVVSGFSSVASRIFFEAHFPTLVNFASLVLVVWFVYARKLMAKNQFSIIVGWFLLTVAAQLFSKRAISEYYFNNLIILSLLLFSLTLSYLHKKSNNLLVPILLSLVLVFNVYSLFSREENKFNYLYKKQVVEFIKSDSMARGYPCIGIDYIADFGRAVGFRYIFWQKGLVAIKPDSGAPVYKIFIPRDELPDDVTPQFGKLGVIRPESVTFNNTSVCTDPINNLDSLWGLTL